MSRILVIGIRVCYLTGVCSYAFMQVTSSPVIWQDIAIGALTVVPPLIGIAYWDFSRRVKKNEEAIEAVGNRFDEKHDKIAEQLVEALQKLSAIEATCHARAQMCPLNDPEKAPHHLNRDL